LIIAVHYVKMPIGNGRGITTKGRPLETMVHLKKSIVEVKAEENCMAHALVIAIAKLTNDTNYKAFRQERKIRAVVGNLLAAVVGNLLATTGIDLKNGGGIPELLRFQKLFKEYRIVFGGFEDV
jgi:hypothetical protein